MVKLSQLVVPLAGAGAAGAAVWGLWRTGYSWAGLLMLSPLFFNWRQFQSSRRLRDTYRRSRPESEVQLSLLQALARAIDAKDHTSRSHVIRLQVYAVGLAGAAKLP